MMKFDKIFYAACTLSLAGVALAFLGSNASLLLFVAAYLLRPALNEFGLAKKVADERERAIHSKSGNIAFIILLLALAGLVLWRLADGRPAGELYTIIGIGLTARALTGLIMNGEYRKAGIIVVSAIGFFLGLFIILEGGFTVLSLAGLVVMIVIFSIAQLGRLLPKTVALFLLVIAALFSMALGLWNFQRADLDKWLLLVLPLLLAAICLGLSGLYKEENVPSKVRSIVFGTFGVGSLVLFTLLISVGIAEDNPHGESKFLEEGEVVEIQGVACTGNIQYYTDGKLEFCFLAREDTLSGQPFAAGTGVHFDTSGTFNWCFLHKDTIVQGYYGSGGGHDFMTTFYPNGQVRTVYLSQDQIIQDVPCARFRFLSAIFGIIHSKHGNTSFHDNGQLKYAELSTACTIQGRDFSRGDAVRFDSDGKLALPDK